MEEIWKDVVGYEGYYMVSNYGNVLSNDRTVLNKKGEMRLHMGRKLLFNLVYGYNTVELCVNGNRKRVGVHILVSRAFISNPLGKPQVNHINSVRTDNRVENLEWVTAKENTTHAWKKGRCTPSMIGRFGADNPHSICVSQFGLDGTFMSDYIGLHEAHRQTGVHFSNIQAACGGRYKTAGGYIWKYKNRVA